VSRPWGGEGALSASWGKAITDKYINICICELYGERNIEVERRADWCGVLAFILSRHLDL
jgi:hypothetical protein